MMFKSILLTLGLFAVQTFSQTSLTINTPTGVVECQPTLLSWTGGTPPYYLSILPGGQPSASPLMSFPPQNGTSLTWNTNVTAGASIGLTLRDSTGTLAQSAPFTINAGSTSCLGSGASTPAGSNTPTTAATTAGTTATSPTTSPTTTATSTSSTPASSGSSGTTSASGAAKTGTASINAASLNLGFAGVAGVAIMAVLA